ncbi:MAG: hypothetical protein P1V51_11955 [Deltaproteobacteria bacterium]|nr:hypothetical protein [Deltaproteobacteria bacterium]
MPTRALPKIAALLSALLLGACGGAVDSDHEAELAYLGLDGAVGRALLLGMSGFNAATSANIPQQVGDGDVAGTMTVAGQVDQGASANKGLRLTVALDGYQDVTDVDQDEDEEVVVSYTTAEAAPMSLELSLRNIPDGTFTGTFGGTATMEGDLEGEVTLDLTLSGSIEEDPDAAGEIRRVTGTVQVTGTATNSGGGVYDIDLSI